MSLWGGGWGERERERESGEEEAERPNERRGAPIQAFCALLGRSCVPEAYQWHTSGIPVAYQWHTQWHTPPDY